MRTRTKLAALTAGVMVAVGIATTATVASASSSDGDSCVMRADNGATACADSETEARAKVDASGYVVAATIWTRTRYRGNSLVFLVPRACSPGYDNEGPRFNWPGVGDFNNKASSLKTYNRCDMKLFGKTRFRGASSTWIDKSPNLGNLGGGWNNRTSSIRLS